MQSQGLLLWYGLQDNAIICWCNWNVWSSFKNKLKRSYHKFLLYEIVNSKGMVIFYGVGRADGI